MIPEYVDICGVRGVVERVRPQVVGIAASRGAAHTRDRRRGRRQPASAQRR